jgi:ubiquinone biosynthesis protein
VPPFPSELAVAELEKAYGRPVAEVFAEFDREPVASASVAQVHFAVLPDGGREVAVKILRPGIQPVIEHDIALLQVAASLLETLWADGRRLKPREVVAEFDKYLHYELDLMREAANCSQLRRNFEGSDLLILPEVHWDWCTHQRDGHGAHARHDHLADRRRCARRVSISRAWPAPASRSSSPRCSATASSTPTCIRATSSSPPRARARGSTSRSTSASSAPCRTSTRTTWHRTSSPSSSATTSASPRHTSNPAGRPRSTRVDEFEAAIRSVCEPFFDRPLKEISLGRVLLRLFQTSRQFNVEVQPQLVLLQKTLLNVEGLGRELDPELDLWQTALPYLERWMSEQLGWLALENNIKREAANWARLLPTLPRLVHQALTATATPAPNRNWKAWPPKCAACASCCGWRLRSPPARWRSRSCANAGPRSGIAGVRIPWL